MTDKKTVVFNVGGTKFEVSRSILQTHPNTLLARSASEPWQQDPNDEIFLDMDGVRFGYCLDYLRHGRVFLPRTVAKMAVLADLEYIGVEEVDESAFVLEDHGGMVTEASRALEPIVEGVDAQVKWHSEMKSCLMLAKACFLKHHQDHSFNIILDESDYCYEEVEKFCCCSEDNRTEAIRNLGIRLKNIDILGQTVWVKLEPADNS